MYRASIIIMYNDQKMHNYFTNDHTPMCFDTMLYQQLLFKYLCNLADYKLPEDDMIVSKHVGVLSFVK